MKKTQQYLYKLTKEIKQNIVSFLNTEDHLQVVKSNSCFSSNYILKDTYMIYKSLVNEIYKNKTFTNPTLLISSNLKHCKNLLKNDIYYSENKVEILANVSGYIYGKLLQLLNNNNQNLSEGKNQMTSIMTRFFNHIVLPENSNNKLLNSNSKNDIKQTNLNINRNNIVIYLLNFQKGSLSFNDKGLKNNSLLALSKSLEVYSNLIRLNLSNNKIEDFGKGSNTNLNSIVLYNKIFKQFLNSNYLKFIELSNCELTLKHIKPIFNNLELSKSIQIINLSNNKISGENSEFIGQFIKNNTSIITLDFSSNILGHFGVKYISDGLNNNSTLKKLDLSYNGICADGAKFLANSLKNSQLDSLNLSGNYLKDEGGKFISDGIKLNTSLSYIFLEDNCFSDTCLIELGKIQTTKLALFSLDFQNQGMSDLAGESIFNCIAANKSKVSSLEFANNNLRILSLTSLLSSMKLFNENVIGRISIENNKIGFKAGEVLSEIIKISFNLKNLNIAGINLEKGIVDLYESIRDSKSLRILDLSNNSLGKYCNYLSGMVNGNCCLKSLTLNLNNIDNDGFYEIVNGLKLNTCLLNLNLRMNKLTSEGVEKANKQLSLNKFKKKFDFSDSVFTPDTDIKCKINQIYKKRDGSLNKVK